MKPLLFAICCFVIVTTTWAGRLRRNVWELSDEPVYNYSKPAETLEINVKEADITTTEFPAALATTTTEEVQELKEVTTPAPLGEKGYEYKTVRQLRYRQRKRRDVSHLPLEYLPPVELPPVPSRDYLPPVERQAAPHLNREYLPPPVVHEAVHLSNEYLPPPPPSKANLKHIEPQEEETTTEIPVPEETTTTEAAPATIATEPALPEVTEELPKVEVKETPEEPETAVLEEDGYHYRKPAVIPDLSIVPDVPDTEIVEGPEEPESLEPLTREYLPPHLDEEIVEIGSPEVYAGEVLTDNGYQYRVIRHLRH